MSHLLDMPFDDARQLKWKKGREERRLEPHEGFIGEPAEELYMEMLDATNYLDEISRKYDVQVPFFAEQAFRSAARWARSLAKR